MTVAFLFPGQSTSLAGLPAAWSRRSDHVRELFDEAARLASVTVQRLTSAPAARRTALFQPAMTALTAGVARELMDEGVMPALVAGHSLGQVAAVAVAGGMDAADAVGVAVTRARLMEREAARRPGSMLAFSAPDRARAEAVLDAARSRGLVSLAGHNMRSQWVASGDAAALAAIAATTFARPLTVEGAWHSPLMAGATGEYRATLRQRLTRPLAIPLVDSRVGGLIRDPSDVVEHMVGQLTEGLDWTATMSGLARAGVTDYVICGPSKLLARFVYAGQPGCRVHGVEWPRDLARTRKAIGA